MQYAHNLDAVHRNAVDQDVVRVCHNLADARNPSKVIEVRVLRQWS